MTLSKKGLQVISLDTNVLVRILIDDKSAEQVKLARKIATKAKKVYIPQIVQAELIWVLKRACGLSKESIISILEELYFNAAFSLQEEENFNIALQYYKNSTVDFSDCLMLAEIVNSENLPLYTFDKKLAKLNGAKIPGASFR